MQKQRPRNSEWTRQEWFWFLRGIANANLLAATLVYFVIWLTRSDIGFYGVALTVLVPALMGVVSAYFWRPLQPNTRQLFLWSLWNTITGLILAMIFLREGSVCIVMASPLFLLMVYGGACLGDSIFRRYSGPLRVSLIPALLLLVMADGFTHHAYRTSVTTEMRVNAPPATVYPYIVAFPCIDHPSDFWLCRLGLPYPVETTASAYRVGAARSCRFSGNVAIGERITALVPNREIDFDVIEMPKYPEIADHATLERGRIALRDNGDGTTTLVGTSWYSLRVFPSVYFGLWSDYLIHQVHLRVFEQIKDSAEAKKTNRSP